MYYVLEYEERDTHTQTEVLSVVSYLGGLKTKQDTNLY